MKYSVDLDLWYDAGLSQFRIFDQNGHRVGHAYAVRDEDACIRSGASVPQDGIIQSSDPRLDGRSVYSLCPESAFASQEDWHGEFDVD